MWCQVQFSTRKEYHKWARIQRPLYDHLCRGNTWDWKSIMKSGLALFSTVSDDPLKNPMGYSVSVTSLYLHNIFPLQIFWAWRCGLVSKVSAAYRVWISSTHLKSRQESMHMQPQHKEWRQMDPLSSSSDQCSCRDKFQLWWDVLSETMMWQKLRTVASIDLWTLNTHSYTWMYMHAHRYTYK